MLAVQPPLCALFWRGAARWPSGPGSVALRRGGGCSLAPSRRCTASCASAAFSSDSWVLVTREAGKNGPLVTRLEALGLAVSEVPLIEHGAGADRPLLASALAQPWDWVVLTSPEAASVFLESWAEAGTPPVRVATVGGGTTLALQGACAVAFTPSVANAETLAKELPASVNAGGGRGLYPASTKAQAELQEGLTARGFAVTRLNTYDTVPATSLPPGATQLAARAAVVTFASPSAVKAWAALLQPHLPPAGQPRVACIGQTSALAAVRLGLRRVHYPDAPGLDGWAQAVQQALRGEQHRDEELMLLAAAPRKQAPHERE